MLSFEGNASPPCNLSPQDCVNRANLQFACKNGSADEVARFLTCTSIGRSAPDWEHFLHGLLLRVISTCTRSQSNAESANKIQILRHLLSAGASVEGCRFEFRRISNTPLLLACATRDISRQAIEILISAGANINAQGAFGSMPLHVAIVNGNYQAVEALIIGGADVNARHAGLSLLHIAIVQCTWRSAKKHIIEALIRGGADVNEQCAGMTPLLMALDTRQRSTVRLLLTLGAAPDVSGQYNSLTPIRLAYERGKTDIALLLLDYGAHFEDDLHQELLAADAKFLRLFGYSFVATIYDNCRQVEC